MPIPQISNNKSLGLLSLPTFSTSKVKAIKENGPAQSKFNQGAVKEISPVPRLTILGQTSATVSIPWLGLNNILMPESIAA